MARTAPTREDDYGYHLAYRFFTHHLIIAKTMFNVEEATQTFIAGSDQHGSVYDLTSRWTSTENLALEMDSDSLEFIDPYSNFSNGLLLLVNEVADLKALQASTKRLKHLRDRRKRESFLRTKSQRLEASLINLRQAAPDWMKMSEDESMAALIEQVAEANRLATLILLLHEPYLPLTQHNAATMSTDAGASAEYEDPASLSGNRNSTECRREEKERHVRSLLELVNGFVASTSLLGPSWALWSTFMAGCCTERERNRIAVMEIFNTAIRLTHRPVSIPSPLEGWLCKESQLLRYLVCWWYKADRSISVDQLTQLIYPRTLFQHFALSRQSGAIATCKPMSRMSASARSQGDDVARSKLEAAKPRPPGQKKRQDVFMNGRAS